ncbi:hypothetical protein NE237_010945 [Protea cynaroides]|uniref:Myb-like domain-containing protein n=1 Tax=Protea cynaroides TaxID=273540 RepID=A0A9Q0L0R7_9MAGN|nr:hypothetical protein NE237_010945 [Protea cynaroides]
MIYLQSLLIFSCSWSRAEDKIFEQALVLFSEEAPDRWHKITGKIPGKTASDVIENYQALVHNVSEINLGRIELPLYKSKSKQSETERKKKGSLGPKKSTVLLIHLFLGRQRAFIGDIRRSEPYALASVSVGASSSANGPVSAPTSDLGSG